MIDAVPEQGRAPAPTASAALGGWLKRRGWLVARLPCALVGLYFAAAAGYALANASEYASTWTLALRYTVVPGVLALALLACALFVPRGTAARVGINALALVAALFAFEAYATVRMLPTYLGNLGAADRDAAGLDEIMRAEDVRPGALLKHLNHLLEVEEPAQAVLANGAPGTNVLLCVRDGRPVHYRADRYGFNNPDDAHERPIQAILFGDSLIEGFCLPPGADTAGRLRASGLNALSIATRGNGPLLELAAIERYGPLLRPEHAVMAFFEGNDWRNLAEELKQPWLLKALDPAAGDDPGEPMAARPDAVAELDAIMAEWPRRDLAPLDVLLHPTKLRNFLALRMTNTALGLQYPHAPTASAERYEAILREAKAAAEGWGGGFSLLYIPQVDRFAGLLPNGFAFDVHRRPVLEAAAAAGVEVIDLTEAFAGDPEPARFYAADGHFSPAGAKAAAAAVADHLERQASALATLQGEAP